MQITISDPAYAARVRQAFEGQPYMHFIGAEMTGLSPGSCEIRLPYRPELSQHDGFFHGGVIGAIADNACGFASYTVAGASQAILTVEYKLNIVSPGIGEALVARGRIVNRPGRCACDPRWPGEAGGDLAQHADAARSGGARYPRLMGHA